MLTELPIFFILVTEEVAREPERDFRRNPMKTTEVTGGIYRLSANGGSEILFESMWPLAHGVAMNSYIVRGRETAIIDGVCGWDGVPQTLFAQLEELDIDLKDIRYVILNHLEPDHTGWLEPFGKLHDGFQLIASAKGLELVRSFYGFDKNLRAVSDGDRLDLGDEKELLFKEIPNVHWPETIATFETGSRTLFPCDLYGSFGSVEPGGAYDDQLEEQQLAFFEEEASRYYSNILATFSSSVGRAIDKLEALEPRIIAPAHGLVWRENPDRIVQLYRRHVSYSLGAAEPEITMIWGSMYGMTERAVEAVAQGIREEEVPVHAFRVPQDHISYILASAWKSSGVFVAAPTYEYRMFPPMAAVLDELGRKKVVRKKAFRIGSFGWSGGAQKELEEIAERFRMKWDFAEPYEFAGAPTERDLEELRKRGRRFAAEVKRFCAEGAVGAAGGVAEPVQSRASNS
jgi:anaerobic nitric oxide reductase flavorubredoxin